MRPRLLFCIALAFSTVTAQNTLEPVRIPYVCAEEDLQFAGMSCPDEEPCPIYLELSSVARNGRKIFAGGNVHGSAATLGSILLASEDSGLTWKEPSPRLQGAAIEQVQFYNLQAGWAAGETQYPLARDPFFLLTTDGGSTWRQKAVGEEGFAGAIQRFWFDSAEHGELVIDAGKASAAGRYLSYESQTGGESWSLTGKSSGAPKLRRAPASAESSPENSDLRIRASKDGKSWQIEERSDRGGAGQWTALALFPIEIATCRMKAGELKEPAPEPDAPAPAPQSTPPTGQKRKK